MLPHLFTRETPQPTARKLLNLRDVSALVNQISPGVLLRSEAPHVSDESPTDVAWPPATVVDLRRANELLVEHPFAGSAKVVHLPLQDPALGSFESSSKLVADGGLTGLYRSLLTQVPTALIQFVSTVALDPTPILVHCAVGKDRTGIAVALVLRLVGIPREAVVADYLQTQPAMELLLPRLFDTHAAMAKLNDEELAAYRTRFTSLPPELFQAVEGAMVDVLDYWDDWEGGTIGWYLEHGGTVEVLTQLKDRLLVK